MIHKGIAQGRQDSFFHLVVLRGSLPFSPHSLTVRKLETLEQCLDHTRHHTVPLPLDVSSTQIVQRTHGGQRRCLSRPSIWYHADEAQVPVSVDDSLGGFSEKSVPKVLLLYKHCKVTVNNVRSRQWLEC
jgi:hypothetical protein